MSDQGKETNLNAGVGKSFEELRLKRNSLTHFSGDYESITLSNVTINGLMNTECFDSLEKIDVTNSYKIAMEFIGHILALTGVEEREIKNAIHAWTGLPPAYQS